MKLSSICITNFKNFQDEELVVIAVDNDPYKLSVLVGLNGAGKSSCIDGLQWVIFNKGPKDMRASKADDLISSGKQFVEVIVRFKCRNNGDSKIEVTRRHRRSGKTNFFAVITDSKSFDIKVEGFVLISKYINELCGIDCMNISRVVIKQQDASTIACSKPMDLLNYFEVIIGSDKIHNAILESLNIIHLKRIDRSTICDSKNGLRMDIETLKPSVEAALTLLLDQQKLNTEYIRLYNKQIAIYTFQVTKAIEHYEDEEIKYTEGIIPIKILKEEILLAVADITKQTSINRKLQNKLEKLSHSSRELEQVIEDYNSESKKLKSEHNTFLRKIKNCQTSVSFTS